MNLLVVYPGRFHPFHRGHKASYDYLVKQFGADSVYIATSDVQTPGTSPFSYSDKVAMMTKLGIPASHIVQVKNPYQVKELVNSLPNPEDTALVYAISEKDMGQDPRFKFGTKKNGEPTYLQPMPENRKKLEPLTKHAYLEITPTVNFKVKGVDADSASAIRKLYGEGNDADRMNIITDLYGSADVELKDLFDERLGVNAPEELIKFGAPKVNAGTAAPAMQRESREQRINRLSERIQFLKQQLQEMRHPQNLDYLDEKIRH